jgi:hypothetical protein
MTIITNKSTATKATNMLQFEIKIYIYFFVVEKKYICFIWWGQRDT